MRTIKFNQIKKTFNDQKNLVITGFGTTNSLDSDLDRVNFYPEDFKKAEKLFFEKGAPVLVDHGENSMFGDSIVGKVVSFKYSDTLNIDNKLGIEVVVVIDNELAIELIESGKLNAFSLAWHPGDIFRSEKDSTKQIHFDIVIDELTICNNPANEDCTFTIVDTSDSDILEFFGLREGQEVEYKKNKAKIKALYLDQNKNPHYTLQFQDKFVKSNIPIPENLVKALGKNKRPGRPSSAQTPAEPSEQIEGSNQNLEGSASSDSNADIKLSETQEKALENKVKEFNEKNPNKKVTKEQLKKVWRRGAGAFSTSHRPGQSRSSWAMARVNTFLNMVAGKDVKESYRRADSDLLLDRQKTKTFNDYPKSATNNAKKALEWREKYPDEVKFGTRVGWARANQLANKEPLSLDVVKRMAQFNRHRSNSKIDPKLRATPWKDRGYGAWLLWGGDEGVDWAIRKLESLEKQKEKTKKIINATIYSKFKKFIMNENQTKLMDKVLELVKMMGLDSEPTNIKFSEKTNLDGDTKLCIYFSLQTELGDRHVVVSSPDDIDELSTEDIYTILDESEEQADDSDTPAEDSREDKMSDKEDKSLEDKMSEYVTKADLDKMLKEFKKSVRVDEATDSKIQKSKKNIIKLD